MNLLRHVYVDSKPDGTPFYVGKGSIHRVQKRSREGSWHTKTAAKYPNWTREIVFSGSDADCLALEIALIAHYGRKNLGLGPLVNLTDGGDGCCGTVVSPETRRKMSDVRRGKPMPLETRLKVSVATGSRTPEMRKAYAQKNIGRKNTQETLLKMSIAAKNRPPISEETRAKLRIANGGRVMSDEARARMSALRLGKPRTEETKMKIRLAFERKKIAAEQRNGNQP